MKRRYVRNTTGLPRPKHSSNYNIPENIEKLQRSTDIASISSQEIDTEPLIQLSRIQVLLNLIHRRNKNQHRTQNFWKWLQILRHSIAQLVSLHRRIVRLEIKTSSTETNINNANTKSATKNTAAAELRRKFEQEAELRSQREVHEDWIRETLVPGCYVAFSAVVGDTQFANLGVVLMGVLADVSSVVGGMRRIDKTPAPLRPPTTSRNAKKAADSAQSIGKTVVGWSTKVTGLDQGEIVERVYDSSDAVTPAKSTSATPTTALDDNDQDFGIIIKRKNPESTSTLVKIPPELPLNIPRQDSLTKHTSTTTKSTTKSTKLESHSSKLTTALHQPSKTSLSQTQPPAKAAKIKSSKLPKKEITSTHNTNNASIPNPEILPTIEESAGSGHQRLKNRVGESARDMRQIGRNFAVSAATADSGDVGFDIGADNANANIKLYSKREGETEGTHTKETKKQKKSKKKRNAIDDIFAGFG